MAMQSAPRFWLSGLTAVVTALIAAPAHAAGTEQRPATIQPLRPLPVASWHARPIRRPEHDGAVIGQTVTVAGAPRLSAGAGYGRPDGSRAVRQVQRLLRRIGYRPGPVDGKFGPLTRSSVQWFQIKHGLRPTGTVGPAELTLLRLRALGRRVAPVPGDRPGAAVPAAVRQDAPQPSPRGANAGSRPGLVVLVVAGICGLLAVGGLLLGRRDRPIRAALPGRRPRREASEPRKSAVGYLRDSDKPEEKRRAEAITRACSERGWTVARIVREGHVNGSPAHERPGLSFALDELAGQKGGRLVACRLDDVGRTRRELAAVLERCSRSQVDVVALDVGLDTGTTAGSLAARCLVAVGDGRSNRQRRTSRPRAKAEA